MLRLPGDTGMPCGGPIHVARWPLRDGAFADSGETSNGADLGAVTLPPVAGMSRMSEGSWASGLPMVRQLWCRA